MRYWNGYLRPEFNKSGMKQITNSGFKTFDRQNNLVTTGNVISNCQFSSFLNEFSTKQYAKEWKDTNEALLQMIAGLGSNVIFYEFFVRYNGKKSVFYQAAVDYETGNKVWSRLLGGRGNRNKRRLASKWIDLYITKKEEV